MNAPEVDIKNQTPPTKVALKLNYMNFESMVRSGTNTDVLSLGPGELIDGRTDRAAFSPTKSKGIIKGTLFATKTAKARQTFR